MDGKKISVEELKSALAGDVDELLSEVVEAMNSAKPGRIIADSEEPVRDASADFRQRLYQKTVDLLQAKQEAFSPSGQAKTVAKQGQTGDKSSDG